MMNRNDSTPNHRREHLLMGWKRGATGMTTGINTQDNQDNHDHRSIPNYHHG